MNDHPIFDISFLGMPDYSCKLSYGDSFILYDNLNEGVFPHKSEIKFFDHMPLRAQFSFSIYCYNGSLDISLGPENIHIETGQMIICGFNSIISQITFSVDCKLIAFCINNSEDTYSKLPQNTSQLYHKFDSNPLVVNLRDDIRPLFVNTYLSLRSWISLPNINHREEVINATFSIFITILSNCIENNDPHKNISRPEQLYQHFIKLVRDHYRTERSLIFYANELCVSPKYLGKIVNELGSRSPIDIIQDYVILEAKVLLRENKYNVRQISEQLNFPNPSYFCKYFHDAVGCTPGEYKRRD